MENDFLPCDHSTIGALHPQSAININGYLSKEQTFEHNDSWNFSRQLSLRFQHCPACGNNDNITFYGKSEVGTQRYRCKCTRQFVSQMDSIYPRLTRRDVFYREFDLQKNKYWKPAALEVLSYIESHKGRLLINRLLNNHFDGKIATQKEYEVLTFFIVHEVYNLVMAR